MSKKKRNKLDLSKDPHAEREASKYEQPIASREHILSILKQAGKPLTESQLVKTLRLRVEQELALSRRLRAMERDGQLMRNRRGAFGLVDKMDLIRGRVIGHRDGFGFLSPETAEDDLFLSPKQMRLVFDGDLVLARHKGFNRRGQEEAHIVEVLERAHQYVVGRLHKEQGYWYVVPDNNRISQHIIVPKKERGNAKEGQIVSIEVLTPPDVDTPAIGRVDEILGDHMAPGMEIDIAIRAHDIPCAWPKTVLAETADLPEVVQEQDKEHRVDLRELLFVTIDGEDARDFDDAVYAERRKGGGWRLWVAIADVSHYVGLGSALDKEAARRGNSVYFPGQVVPMLPEVLSNGLCSLNPNTDRLCMVCEMTISAAGRISGYEFYEGVFRSRARLTYTQVGRFLETSQLQNKKLHMPLRVLEEVFHSLRDARVQRGAIDFESDETRIVFGKDRKIETIVPVVRNDAHKLIEECMLAANISAARFIAALDTPAVYRIHAGPSEEKLFTLREFLEESGLRLGGGMKPEPKHYQALNEALEGRLDAKIVQSMMLRSMSQAIYHIENDGHFGLAYSAYTHFTSPIRRYSDLLVHRQIRAAIRSRAAIKHLRRVRGAKPIAKKQIYPYTPGEVLSYTEHCSMTERRADEATRDVVAFLKCEYLLDRLGEEFSGVVNAVTRFGLFVELEDLYVEGLVHVTALRNDYYHFDSARQSLTGERSGDSYHLGDRVLVRLAAVNLDDKKIDLDIVSASVGKKPRSTSRKNSNARRKSSQSKKTEKQAKKPRKKDKRRTRKRRR